jgi:hypothetical protein
VYKCSVCDKIYKRIPKKVAPFFDGTALFCRKCSRKHWGLAFWAEEKTEYILRGLDLSNMDIVRTIVGYYNMDVKIQATNPVLRPRELRYGR